MKYRISENISETPEGFLVCIGVPIARTGDMVYGPGETPISDDSKVTITRDEAEVFKPETIASFEGKPITIKHPEEFVNPDNWADLAKGTMQNVRRGKGDQANDLIADLLITDKMAIELVKNGLREVSCGYEADYDQIDDTKGKQKNIVGNHLALVHQGRAGSGYAINDHKGDTQMKLKDRIKAIFAKAQDDAMKVADEALKEKKVTDSDEEEAEDDMGYDELVKVINELPDKVAAAMGKKEGKDDARGERVVKEGEAGDDEEESKDDDMQMEERLKTLEAAVEKCLEFMSKAKGNDEEEEMGDEDGEEEEEGQDDDFENSSMVGDSAEDDTFSRAEILCPGIKKSKDMKEKALKAAWGTIEGKKVLAPLCGGKAPTFDSKEKVNTLFIAASEVMKSARAQELVNSRRKTNDYVPSLENESFVSAEKLNEINAKFYKKA